MRLFSAGAIRPGRVSAHVFRALCCSLLRRCQRRPRAEAQTTVVLNVPDSQVIDTTIRNGPYAATNQDGPVLLTRSSTVPEWERRTILSFNASSDSRSNRHHVRHADADAEVRTGHSGCHASGHGLRLAAAFQETQASWNNRQTGVAWQTPGGDLGEVAASGTVTNVAGAKITFDLTALAQRAVNGEFERQVRIALVDVGGGGDAKDSYREYHSSEASTAGNRPQLTVRYGTTPPGTTIDVPAGGDLQAALNQAQPGATIRLAAGATYTGNFRLPAKGGTSFIVITTNTSLPAGRNPDRSELSDAAGDDQVAERRVGADHRERRELLPHRRRGLRRQRQRRWRRDRARPRRPDHARRGAAPSSSSIACSSPATPRSASGAGSR